MAPRSSMIQKAKKNDVRKQVRQALRLSKELKNYAATSTNVDTVAGQMYYLSQGVIQGDAINQRSGDSISPTRLDLNYSLISGVGSTNSVHRVVVFQDRYNLGATPFIVDVLDGGVFNSTYNVRNRQQNRFKILYDKMHGIVGAADSAATHVQKRINLKGKIEYNASTNVVGANGPGAIMMFTLCDSVAVSTATFSFYSSLFYTDA